MGRGGGGGGGGGSCDDHQHQHLLVSEDVLIQILLWLPVVSLLRFKSVCKSWRSIIQSPFFIHLHATTTKLGGSGSGSGVLINLRVQEKKGNILRLSGEEFEFFEYLGIPATLLELMEEGLKGCVGFSVVGGCDGIICLHDVFSRNVALWNPAIKQSRLVPKPSNLLGNPNCFDNIFKEGGDDDGYWAEDFVRFGIDIKTNDYKVLLITTYKLRRGLTHSEYPHERRVHVYSLSTDSWKCIDATLSDVHPDIDIDIKVFSKYIQGLYLNGSYFFTADYLNKDMPLLLSFDFTEEIFRTIQPPFDLRSNYNYISGNVYFISFGEKVALIDVKKEEEVHDCFEYDIWVLNEQHGVKEPWTKFFTIGPPDNLSNDPLFITNNGEFAITSGWYWQDDREQDVPKLQLLNLTTGEKKVLQCDGESPSTGAVYIYKPSLMPIGGNAAAYNSRFLEFDEDYDSTTRDSGTWQKRIERYTAQLEKGELETLEELREIMSAEEKEPETLIKGSKKLKLKVDV